MSEEALYKYLEEMKNGLTNHITLSNAELKEDIKELKEEVKEVTKEQNNFNLKVKELEDDIDEIKKNEKKREKKKLITVERAIIILLFVGNMVQGFKEEIFNTEDQTNKVIEVLNKKYELKEKK